MHALPLRLPRRGAPQLLAFAAILLVDWLVSPQFFDLRMQGGRLFGSLIDVFNRGAPVALLSIGMVLVVATRGIDLSVGAVMAIAGAVAASLADTHALPAVLAAALGARILCGAWNGILVAVLVPALAVAGLFAIERESAVADTIRAWWFLRRARRQTRARLKETRTELAALMEEIYEWLSAERPVQADARTPN